jgi:hypothetical protein
MFIDLRCLIPALHRSAMYPLKKRRNDQKSAINLSRTPGAPLERKSCELAAINMSLLWSEEVGVVQLTLEP